jgi:hypothetical protein
MTASQEVLSTSRHGMQTYQCLDIENNHLNSVMQ